MPLTSKSRDAIFQMLRKSLKKQCPPMVCTKDTKDCYEVIGNKPVPYGSTKKIVPGMYFASAVARKDMVSFYVMPIYMREKEYATIAPTVIKALKGKACFNFRNEAQVVPEELDALLDRGADAWKKMGYMK